MSQFSLEKIISVASARMKEDLRQRFVEHPGELGEEREAIIRSFLKAYLPKRFEISTGFVFDCEGNVSNQIDIVIADSLVCPLIETVGGKRYYPCESVVAVGQVKSSVTSNTELRSALDNLESVKRLDRSAKGTALDSRHGEQIDHIEDHLHQLFSFLFITGRAISENTIQEKMLDYIVGREAHLWPNALIAIDQYLVTFCCDDGVCPNPMHARGIAIQRQQENIDLVMRFFLLLGRAIEVIRVSGLPYWEYLYSASKWDASVVYAATDDPPPYLCSL